MACQQHHQQCSQEYDQYFRNIEHRSPQQAAVFGYAWGCRLLQPQARAQGDPSPPRLLQWTENRHQRDRECVLPIHDCHLRAPVEKRRIGRIVPVFQPADEVVVVLVLAGKRAFLNGLPGAGGEAVVIVEDLSARRDGELAVQVDRRRTGNAILVG